MKYLWNLVLEENKRGFTYYECTSEVEQNYGLATPKTKVKSYSPGHSAIKPIFDAATKLCEILKLELIDANCEYLLISREIKRLVVIYKFGLFEAKCENGTVKVGTENGHAFTKEQFDAIFEFIDLLIKHNWFN